MAVLAVLAVTDDDGRLGRVDDDNRVGHVDIDGWIGHFARTQDWRLPAERMAFAVTDEAFASVWAETMALLAFGWRGACPIDLTSPNARFEFDFRLPALQPGRFSYIWRHLRNCTV